MSLKDIISQMRVKPRFCPMCNDTIKCSNQCIDCAKQIQKTFKTHCDKRVVDEDEIVYWVGDVGFEMMLNHGVITPCGKKYLI